MGRFIDLTGQKFNRLTVIEKTDLRTNEKKIIWKVKCDCGNVVLVSGKSMKAGNSESCGCLHKERVAEGNIKKSTSHGDASRKSRTKLFSVYNGMKARCYYEKHKYFKNYGGRGITVCDEWRGSNYYATFRDWALANGYKEGLEIDRIDNDGSYEPLNCRWVTRSVQALNKRKGKK